MLFNYLYTGVDSKGKFFKNISFDRNKMHNQYLLTELIRAQVRAEQDTVKKELQDHEINIDDLVITGERSLRDVFHPSAAYNRIEREIFREQQYSDETLQLFSIYVEGVVSNSSFKAYIGHKDILFPFMYEPTKASLEILEKIEKYLLQLQADQEHR